ncbi:MAG: filamentous hemagglutinin N-terminal domain-containing protein, partial [Chlamydiia bacterium]|nr:filamentous hemagglutinin N-terminal domain-containing protein [Chlamydiia bacterium]
MNLQKVLFFLLSIGGSTLLAAPSGGNVIQGKADFHVAKQGLQIKAADQTVIQWQDFSIGKGEFVKFVQPHSDATVVNRVISDQLSEIYGSLKANGHVYLINPAGIVVGAEGLIQAAGFIASTFDFTKSKEGMVFKGDSKAIIVNEGQIETPNGDVFLIGYQVVNEGEIHGKTVGLAGGSEVLLKPAGSERLFVKAEQRIPTSGTAVENKGTIEALKTELKGDGNAFSYAIKNDGLIEATRLYEENGEIFLLSEGGVVSHGGTLIAEGGEVRLLGHTVELKEGSLIDVSHDTKPG